VESLFFGANLRTVAVSNCEIRNLWSDSKPLQEHLVASAIFA
jgi:hypothetical protein